MVENKNLVSITDGAIQELKKLFKEHNLPEEQGLRIGVKGGGCSGFSYIMGFDKKKDNDAVFEQDGLKVFIEKAHGLYLSGMQVDYQDGLNARGFIFNNPNADETCGCGSSFSA
ncbi:MAG: iron-sulfur cluster assembly accessory protein [Chitinophagaceae bacterium]|nr:MAG: iron-sulfur cluster assembly accessory protein [Chitinophagaceae bacterium]